MLAVSTSQCMNFNFVISDHSNAGRRKNLISSMVINKRDELLFDNCVLGCTYECVRITKKE